MSEEKIIELMEDGFKKFGWNTWKSKSSIIFDMKSKYGSTFDTTIASKIYDDIYAREIKKIEEEE